MPLRQLASEAKAYSSEEAALEAAEIWINGQGDDYHFAQAHKYEDGWRGVVFSRDEDHPRRVGFVYEDYFGFIA